MMIDDPYEDLPMEASARDRAKQERSSFWWPKTDSFENARQAAKRGSVVYGLTAFSLLMVFLVATFLTEHRFHFVVADFPLLILTPLFVYLTWRSYERPTVLLNSLAAAYMALVLGSGVALFFELNKPEAVVGLFMPFLALVSAIGGLRGSMAVRRFERQAPASKQGYSPV
jgi:hypothetical protein